ncbi:hypothetical protein F4561_003977 [Lipingzhangella halophila]|uniref:Uncharacterized protein n=1 Tax=Lipingzhangella halophila TaxID=1783352 RepID=A0A7W7RJR1_9ACTN|nr:hypothetical protein [Lipingzhangella halophila]MBB4933157.1 hypothetical protein [Lipingzhangella halophila]
MKKILKNKRLRAALAWLVIGVTAFFFARSLIGNWQRLEEVDLSVNGWSVLAVLLFAGAVASSGLLWGDILNRLSSDKKIHAAEAVRVHIMSWLLKYIPGQAGSFLSKLGWGIKHGYSKKLVSITFIYENAFLLLASIIGSLPVIALLFRDQFAEGLSMFAPLLLAVPLLFFCRKTCFITR